MTRYLGVDYGTKRIGLAISDVGGTIASPLVTVEAKGAVADHVNAVLAETNDYAFDEIVVGLPLNMDGTEGEQAKITRRFGDVLSEASGKPVRYFDERLSSLEAEEKLREADLGRSKKKARVDALAAQITLQEFLDTLL